MFRAGGYRAVLAAYLVIDLIWQFFDYQLWQKQNMDLMLAMFRSFASAEFTLQRESLER